MCRNLTPNDIQKVRKLKEIRKENNDIRWILSDYLNNNPCFITKKLIESVNQDGSLSEEMIYLGLIIGLYEFDIETNELDKKLANNYLRPAIKKLDKKSYTENPYYRNIHIPEVRLGDWELKYETYEPYEAFIYNDLIITGNFKEIPRIGFFNEKFRFPAVMENGHEWMAIKPNEIETMQPLINTIEGNIATFGLGLGYFTYMASIKENVHSIVVVEQNKDVIQLFKDYILPQFQYKEKVKIISADAFEYATKEMPNKNFDYVFVDLWHDESDGLELYCKMKKNEHLNSKTQFFYWIEDSLLSSLRWQIFDWVIENAHSYKDIVNYLSKPFLQKLITISTNCNFSTVILE